MAFLIRGPAGIWRANFLLPRCQGAKVPSDAKVQHTALGPPYYYYLLYPEFQFEAKSGSTLSQPEESLLRIYEGPKSNWY